MTRSPIGFVVVSLLAMLAGSPAPAQYPYGTGSPSGNGAEPHLASPQAYLGNSSFGYIVSNGVPGAGAYIAISLVPTQGMVNGIPTNIDANQLLSLTFFNLDAQGGAFFPASLGGFTSPSFAGFNFYSQLFVLDITAPGNVAASKGLRTEFTLPPLVFVGSNLGAGGPQFFVDPAGPVVTSTVNGVNTNTDGAVFTTDGRHLFVVSSTTRQINHADLTGPTPVWTTLHNFGAGQDLTGLALDTDNDVLWTVDVPTMGSAFAVGLDAKPSSPTFGNVIYSIAVPATGSVGEWALSGLHVGAFSHLFNHDISIIDLDPTSATFTQILMTLSTPFMGGELVSDVAFSQDGDQLFASLTNSVMPAEVARYAFSLGAWIDHNPSTAFIDNLGPLSNPPLAFGAQPTSLKVASYAPSDWFFITGIGGASGGWAGRVDFGSPTSGSWSFTPATGAILDSPWYGGIDPGGTRVAVATLQGGTSASLTIFDASTMTSLSSVPLPGAGFFSGATLGDVVWR